MLGQDVALQLLEAVCQLVGLARANQHDECALHWLVHRSKATAAELATSRGLRPRAPQHCHREESKGQS